MQLYSMEIGTPPLYTEVNRVCRDLDFTQLEHLGPFVRVLGYVTSWSERYKHDDDKIITGKMIGGAECNLAGSFMLWRGAPM